MGEEVVGGLRFVCSDMWKAYLTGIAAKAGQALHVLDRFHITMHLNQAVDEVRRAESGRLRGRPLAQKLKHMRWKLLRRGSRVRGRAKQRLCGLLRANLATGRPRMLRSHEELILNWFRAKGEIDFAIAIDQCGGETM